MARDLRLAAAQAPHFHTHQNPFRFQLNTPASVVIVFCGIGASISLMGVVALYFWCCKSTRNQQVDEDLIFSVAEQENRAAREKLSRRVVEKLPIASYESVVAGSEENGGDYRECCSVCLAEFDNAEDHADKLQIRMLPDCGHFFHTECIQMWLCSYLSCPLCRRNITVLPPPVAPVAAAAAVENDSQDSSVNGDSSADSAPGPILTADQHHQHPQSGAAADSVNAENNGSTARDVIPATVTVTVIVGSSEGLSNTNSATK